MTTPKFAVEISEKYKSGVAHAFVLSGNIGDYVSPGVTLKSFLTSWLGKDRCLVFYDRRGFSFPTQSVEKNFREVVGLDQAQGQAVNPALAMLQPQGQQQQPLPSSPEAALPLIEKFLRVSEKGSAAVVVEYTEAIMPAKDLGTMSPAELTNYVTLSKWGNDPELEARGNIVLLVGNMVEISDNLKVASSKYAQVEIDYPNTQTRQDFVEWYIEDKGIDLGQLTTAQVANLTAGLNLMMIEDVLLRAAMVGQVSIDMIKDRKSEIIKAEYGEVLEVLNPTGGFETIGGLEYIKQYFVKSVINPIKAGNSKRVPMGTLMLGPAGTGKSIMATAVAKEAGINAVKLNIGGQIADKYQGEGEKKLKKALAGILNFAPTIVFIDEIDQTVSRGSGENQQDSRIFQMLLEFMAETDHRGQVVFLAASNRPDLMDAALRRPGRFDDKIAFLVPDADERQAIFEVFCKKFEIGKVAIPQAAIDATEGYTGAEIEAIARKAAMIMQDEAQTPEAALTQAAQRIKNTTQAIDLMTALALAEISDSDLIPPRYQKIWQDQAGLAEQISSGRANDTRQARSAI